MTDPLPHPALSLRRILTGLDSTITDGQLEFLHLRVYSPCSALSYFVRH